jgi:hypothetical protein
VISLKKISRAELRRLKPGTWVAWKKTTWNSPDEKKFAFHEGQVLAQPVRSGHDIEVIFDGLAKAVQKNRLFQVQPVITIEDMHQQFDYNS